MTAEKMDIIKTTSGRGNPAQTNGGEWEWPAATAGTARHAYGHTATGYLKSKVPAGHVLLTSSWSAV
jgi:hypothetical protein